MEREPDFELKVWLSPAGYQAQYIIYGKIVFDGCLDFQEELTNKELACNWLRVESIMMLERLRRVVV